MPKIVIQNNPWIQFDVNQPIEIIDHRIDSKTGSLYFTYRVRFTISGNEFYENSVFLALSDETPYRTPPNMFKDRNVKTSLDALNNIKDYDLRRASRFSQNLSYFVSKDISSIDVRKGFVDLEIQDRKSNNTKKTFLYFLTRQNNSDKVITTITFSNLDLIKRYEIPVSNFFLNTSKIKFNKRRIGIKALDKRIKKFAVYTENVYNANQKQKDKSLEPIFVDVENSNAFIDIDEIDTITRTYRVTPVSFYTGTPVAVYKEIFVNPEHLINNNCLIYATAVNTNSVSLNVTSIPRFCLNARILRRNLTQRDLTYSYVPTVESYNLATPDVLSQGALGSTTITFIDSSIVPYNAYDYKVEFEYFDGTKKVSDSNCTIFPQILNDVAKLTVNLSSEELVSDNARRTFDVNVEYIQSSNTSKLINDLKSLGIDNIFPNEIKNISTELDPIIKILVTKTNLLSGIEERVGLFEKGQITITNSSSEDIVYKFEVCVKGPADVIEEVGASSNFFSLGGHKDALSPLLGSRVLTASNVTKKTNFTQKFFSKSVITTGALKYGSTLPTRVAGIESGRTNIFQTLIFVNQKKVPSIKTFKITKRSDALIASWSGENLDDVDKFEILINDLVLPCVASIHQENYFATIPGNIQSTPKLRIVFVSGESTILEFTT